MLAGELVEALDPEPGQVAVDCTFGSGGHARLIADRIGSGGELICIDRDPHAEERFAELRRQAPALTRFIHGNYADVLPELGGGGLRADLLYMDLGISSVQVDARERGFSYSYDAPLDMRMDPAQALDARTVVNEWPEERLAAIFREYGEERYARPIAREIARRRAARSARDHDRSGRARSSARSRRRRSSAPAIRRAGSSRRSGSPSTTSSARSSAPCRWRGTWCARAAGWR